MLFLAAPFFSVPFLALLFLREAFFFDPIFAVHGSDRTEELLTDEFAWGLERSFGFLVLTASLSRNLEVGEMFGLLDAHVLF